MALLIHFRHDIDPDDGMHSLEAWLPGDTLFPSGEMHWHGHRVEEEGFLYHEAGEVHRLMVDPHRQRQGIATALFFEGQKYSPQPVHSPYRTNQGDAWARKVGGRLPRADSETGARSYDS